MAKYGSNSVGWVLVDGYNLLASTIEELDMPTPEAVLQESHGLGASWFESLATGLRKAMASCKGLYDDLADGINQAFNEQQQTLRVMCWNITGNAIGNTFTGAAGVFNHQYKRLFSRGKLHGAEAVTTITGAVEEGIILQHLTAKTIDWNTEGAESVDHGASTSAGGAGYQHVVEFSGFTGFIGKVRHSADDAVYVDLVTFANVAANKNGQRVAVAGTVNRHLAYQGDVTGAGSIQVMGGFSRAA